MSTFTSGTAGRVIAGATTVAGIKSWKLDQVAADIPIPHFESPTDASGRVWPEYLVGLCGATGSLEGQFDSAAGTATDQYIAVGIPGTLVLQFSKTSTWGFTVTVIITAFGSGTNVENQPATFTASFRVTGIVPFSAAT